jgi:hypothetical protein
MMAAVTAKAKTRNRNSDKDDMPGLCLLVVVVAAMLVLGGESAIARVKEAVRAAAEEVENGWGRWRLCSVFLF